MLLYPRNHLPMESTIRASSIEIKALNHFRVITIWHDVLSCSALKKESQASEVYRKLLSDEIFTLAFQDITGCESWVFTKILDATELEEWKHNQELHGNLSVRQLANRTEEIEFTVEKELERLSRALNRQVPASTTQNQRDPNIPFDLTRTYIFAHSILIYLNTILSGPSADVPEVHDSIDRAISAWKLCPPGTSARCLAWPYYVSASLATGTQREFFKTTISNFQTVDPASGSQADLKCIIEGCWQEVDIRRSGLDTCCDWRDVMDRLNLGYIFT